MDIEFALDVKEKIEQIVDLLEFKHIDTKRIVCMRSYGSKSWANARIWSIPRIWQKALNIPPRYVIEVLSMHFDNLSETDQEKVLIHELLHIPKTFSGALVPHRCFGKKISTTVIEKFYRQYKEKLEQNNGHLL
ncbi:MAG: putative metallopeptidase [Euryarchaeota archaeon]|nr:putative metallopeptidase [Euryarchaeota archaeon]